MDFMFDNLLDKATAAVQSVLSNRLHFTAGDLKSHLQKTVQAEGLEIASLACATNQLVMQIKQPMAFLGGFVLRAFAGYAVRVAGALGRR